MPIANYTTQVPAENSVYEIIRMLTAHHATAVMINNDEHQQPCGVSFVIDTRSGPAQFTLPANIDAIQKVLDRQVRSVITLYQLRKEHNFSLPEGRG